MQVLAGPSERLMTEEARRQPNFGGRPWKDVTLLLARHGRLFLPLIVLAAALAATLLLPNSLAVQPLAAAALLDTSTISCADLARKVEKRRWTTLGMAGGGG